MLGFCVLGRMKACGMKFMDEVGHRQMGVVKGSELEKEDLHYEPTYD